MKQHASKPIHRSIVFASCVEVVVASGFTVGCELLVGIKDVEVRTDPYTCEWARAFGDPTTTIGGMDVDKLHGSLWLTGGFEGTLQVDGDQQFSLLAGGGKDIFVIRISMGDGAPNQMSSRRFGNAAGVIANNKHEGTGIAVSGDYVYFTGSYDEITGNYPGSLDVGGTCTVTQPTTLGSTDVFVSRIDATSPGNEKCRTYGWGNPDNSAGIAIDGTYVVISGTVHAASQLFVLVYYLDLGFFTGGAFPTDPPGAVVVEPHGIRASSNISYIAAKFQGGDIYLDNPGGKISAQGTDGFLVSHYYPGIAAPGAMQWVNAYGGVGLQSVQAIALKGPTDLFATGKFSTQIDLTPLGTGGEYSTPVNHDAFIVKVDHSVMGDNYLWSKQIYGDLDQSGEAVAAAGNGKVLVAGNFAGALNVDNAMLNSKDGDDIFIVQINDEGTTGTLDWVASLGGPRDQQVTHIAVVGPDIYIAGTFNDKFQIASCPELATTSGTRRAFIAKLTRK